MDFPGAASRITAGRRGGGLLRIGRRQHAWPTPRDHVSAIILYQTVDYFRRVHIFNLIVEDCPNDAVDGTAQPLSEGASSHG